MTFNLWRQIAAKGPIAAGIPEDRPGVKTTTRLAPEQELY